MWKWGGENIRGAKCRENREIKEEKKYMRGNEECERRLN